MPSQKKLDQKNKLETFFTDYPNFTLIKFEKTTHQNLETLRKELKKVGARIKVIKNTIFEKALSSASLKNKEIGTFSKKALPLKDNSALLGLPQNWSDGLNAFYRFIQKEKSLSFKLGILDKTVYLSEDLLKISNIPSREILMGKIIGSMKAPIANTVYAMKYNITKFVYILKEKSKKGGDTNG